MHFRNLWTRQPHAAAQGDDDIRSVDAPASIPLPFDTVPSLQELVDDATSRAERLTTSGGADEFCGHTFDAHYDHWRTEATITGLSLAGEQRRIDRVLVDEAHHEAHRLQARVDSAQEHATRATAHADAVWAEYSSTPQQTT